MSTTMMMLGGGVAPNPTVTSVTIAIIQSGSACATNRFVVNNEWVIANPDDTNYELHIYSRAENTFPFTNPLIGSGSFPTRSCADGSSLQEEWNDSAATYAATGATTINYQTWVKVYNKNTKVYVHDKAATQNTAAVMEICPV